MKRLFPLLFALPFALTAQTKTENYTVVRQYKDATTTALPDNSPDLITDVTYYDGLGRPKQQLANKQSAQGENIVTHIEYDAFGRQKKEYLPYPNAVQDLEVDPSALSGTQGFYTTYNGGTAYPYGEKFFEASPLNRVLKQSAPGDPWAGDPNSDDDHTIRFEYEANKEEDY
ncbi:type IV secretion protein Rhs, partial [Flavobacterium sp. MAH-1]